MGDRKVISLFIIYSWQHYELYEKLVNVLDTMTSYDWINNSAPRVNADNNSSKTDHIKSDLIDRIKRSNCVLIILSDNINREWISFEITAARSLGKPIIGIRPDASGINSLSENILDGIVGQDAELISQTLYVATHKV